MPAARRTAKPAKAKPRARTQTPGPRGRRDPRIETVDEALALIEQNGAITLVPAGTRPSLVTAVAGERVAGSWWSHPRGKAIYDIATALGDTGDVLISKLVDGKVTFLHRALWPALYRVVTDPKAKAARRRGLTAAARALLDRVERDGSVTCDGPADRAARRLLESAALVHTTSEHTDKGSHAAVLTAWTSWAPADVVTAAKDLALADARASLAAAGITL
jgi:hypothetical protein